MSLMIKEGVINYRFRSENEPEYVSFIGDAIMVSELKQLIEEKKQSGIIRTKRKN